MIDIQFLANENAKLANLKPAPRTVFWFDVDLVELSLLNRCYGREKGNDFLKSLEAFLKQMPEVSACTYAGAGRFVFDVITQKSYTDDEIIRYWKENFNKFIQIYQKDYPEFCIRISCGICPLVNDSFEAIENAALARKESRKNKANIPVVFTKELIDGLNALHKKETEIRKAMIEDRFIYFLQPIVELETGKIVAAEALARCVSPTGTILYPDSFLPIMEENGSIVELDFMLLEKVCKRLRERMEEGKPVVCTSINLSRLHLEDNSTADTILSIAKKYDIPSNLLNFEITETLPVDEFSKAKELIDKLRLQGFRVSIDDYGSGYNGITIWQDLDFDVLKMDRKFLSEDAEMKTRNTILIPNTINIAKKMNISVVCEGVERDDQANALLKWGCDTAQGFYFSRPIPEKEFYERFEETNGTFPLVYKK